MPAQLNERLDLRRPFTRADAIAAGISPGMLRGSKFRRIFRDVYVHELARASPLTRVRAALLIHPLSAFASHASAARVYDVPLPLLGDEHVSVFSAGERRRRTGIVNHVVEPNAEVREVDGLRVSAPARMFVELASVLGLVDLVVVGDALVRLRLVTTEELIGYAATWRNRGVALARRAASLVRDRVDSPMETRLRLLIVLAGLPEPEVNRRITDDQGRTLYRLDLCYPSLRLIIEYDGRQHSEDPAQADWDISRREWFDHHDWMILPVVAKGIYQRPDQTLERVFAALKLRGCPNLPRRLDETWRAHFPVRKG